MAQSYYQLHAKYTVNRMDVISLPPMQHHELNVSE